MTNAISMIGLTKHYKGVEALTDLTLDVPAGTVFGFLGPNGAGKTTAAQGPRRPRPTDGRSARPSTASPVSAAGDHRRELGYLAQDPRFYGWMTGRETLRYVARFRGTDGDTRALGSTSSSSGSGSPTPRDRRTSTYSGGMRQRLGIAQALVGRPGRHPARRAGLRPRPHRPQGRPRPDARAEGRDDGLLLHAHPRRRPAGQRPRRDPRPRPARQGRTDPGPARVVHHRTCSGSSSAARTTRPTPGSAQLAGVAIGHVGGRRRRDRDVRRHHPGRRVRRRPALDHRLRRRRRA